MDLPKNIKSILSQVDESRLTEAIKLYELLFAINPTASEEALTQLVKIALWFKNTCKYMVMPDGTNPVQKFRGAKSISKVINKKVTDLLETYNEADPMDLALIDTKMYQLMSNIQAKESSSADEEIVVVKIKQFLQMLKDATAEDDSITLKEDESTNRYRSVAAYQIARVLQETVGKKVRKTLSSAYDSKKSKSTTALFSRVLQMTLALVGDYSYDQQELIASAFKLLSDDTILHTKI